MKNDLFGLLTRSSFGRSTLAQTFVPGDGPALDMKVIREGQRKERM